MLLDYQRVVTVLESPCRDISSISGNINIPDFWELLSHFRCFFLRNGSIKCERVVHLIGDVVLLSHPNSIAWSMGVVADWGRAT